MTGPMTGPMTGGITDCLPHDPALPHLARALDGAAMAQAFGALLDGQGLVVRGCSVDRVKYRPGRNASLSYLLDLQAPGGGRHFSQRVAARLCSGGQSAGRHASAIGRPLLPSAAGPAVSHLPALDMLAWWWPNDAKLGAAAVLADTERLHTQVLPAVVAALSGGAGQLLAHSVQVAQHVPESRLCARVDLQWQAGGRCVRRRVYAKSSREPDSARAHAILAALQASPAWQAGRLHTPQALLCQPALDLHWQQALPGQAMLDVPGAMARLSDALGAQLAALHATPVPGSRTLTAAALQQQLDTVLPLLAAALPASRPELAAAGRMLADGLRHLDGLPLATLHGDLHPRNILVEGDALGLIDLDGLRRGPALLELGAWIADSQYRALLAGQPPAQDAAHWQALLAGHARAGGGRPAAAALAWATAWNLLTQRAWRCVANLKPGRLAIAPALVAQALDLAGGAVLATT